MNKPDVPSQPFGEILQPLENATLVAVFVNRTYHKRGDGKIEERSPRANGRTYTRVLDALPAYAKGVD